MRWQPSRPPPSQQLAVTQGLQALHQSGEVVRDRPGHEGGVGLAFRIASLLHRLLSYHPGLCWMSDLCNRYPHHPEYNRWLMHLLSTGGLNNPLFRLVRPGERVEIEMSAYPGEKFRGRVTQIADTVDPTTRTIKVRAQM